MKNQKTKGNLLLLLTAFIWGTSFIAQSVGVEKVSAATFVGVRSIIGGIVLLPVIFISDMFEKKNGKSESKWDKNVLIGGFFCGLCLCLASTVQTVGMQYTGPGKAGFITALYMVIIPIIRLFMGKKPDILTVAAVIVAVAGMYFLCLTSDLGINKGDIYIFICAFLFSAHVLVIDYFSPKTDGVKLSCVQFMVSGILASVWALLFDKPQLADVVNCWKPICYSGALSCGVAYTLQVIGQKYTDPTSASILMSLESVFSTLSAAFLAACGWSLTGGTLSAREIIGCVLMFCAIMLVQLPDMKKASKKCKGLI